MVRRPAGEHCPDPGRDPRQAETSGRQIKPPTRSGPVRSAATPHPTARATPAARPGPLHPTRHATAASASPSAGPERASRPRRVSIRGIAPPRGRGPGYTWAFKLAPRSGA